MFIDAEQMVPDQRLAADICIVGAGAAGLVLARAVSRQTNLNVVVLEGGAMRPRSNTQTLYRADIVGLPYDTERSRTLAYGGSTNCWGGYCRPFSEWDFTRRDWLAESGWPIAYEELFPYYQRAHDEWHIDYNNYDVAQWARRFERDNLQLLSIDDARLVTRIYQLSGATRYGALNARAYGVMRGVSIVVNAVVTELHAHATQDRISYIAASTLSGRKLRIDATHFVLAAGGIENPRLLLASRSKYPNGIGNQNDLVGRYFMEHPLFNAADITFTGDFNPDGYDSAYAYFHLPAVASLGLSTAVQQAEGLLGSKCYIESVYRGEQSAGVAHLHELFRHLRMRSIPADMVQRLVGILWEFPAVYSYFLGKRYRIGRYLRGYRIKCIVEPEPVADSRVTLSDQRDELGRHVPKLDWQLSPLVKKTLLRTLETIAQALHDSELANISIDPCIRDGGWLERVEIVNHHMGTTRMHTDMGKGVVDTDCRVHGMDNLYVAGSSVFPTAGIDSPTLTLTALSLRLADHLKDTVAIGQRSGAVTTGATIAKRASKERVEVC
jgi:choline dehydrogenase-like flavoprotein